MEFRFKQFAVRHEASAMKVGTDGVTLGAWARCVGRVLDVGCGCGLIGLMAAQRGADRVTMVEIDPEAAAEAAENAVRSPWAEKIEVWQGDYAEFGVAIESQAGTPALRFDSIVSNPPFFATGELAPDGARAQARHEFSLPPERFMARSAQLLAAEGCVSIIIPPDREGDWTAAAAMAGLFPSRRCELFTKGARLDSGSQARKPALRGGAQVENLLYETSRSQAGKPALLPRRVLLEYRREVTAVEETELRISTEEYNELVKDFYL